MSNRLTKVVQNYEVKLRLGAGGRLSEGEIRRRVTGYSIFAAKDNLILTQVRQVLCSHGIVPMMFPAYHAFSRELGKQSRQDYSAENLQRMLAVTVAKWVMRGLVQAALLDIALIVFNLSPPRSQSDESAAVASVAPDLTGGV
jgi:hypothetical protein